MLKIELSEDSVEILGFILETHKRLISERFSDNELMKSSALADVAEIEASLAAGE